MRTVPVLGLAILLAVPAFALAQANIAGKWVGEMRQAYGATAVTLELTVSGTLVTGKMTQGRGQPIDITNTKLDGVTLRFSSVTGGGGFGSNATPGFPVHYTAKINGNEMTLTRQAVSPAESGEARGRPEITFTLKKE